MLFIILMLGILLGLFKAISNFSEEFISF